MDRLFLAVRFVWTRPLSWVSVVGIWLSVTALLCTVGIMTGFLGEMRSVIRGTTSDVILTPVSVQLRPDLRMPAPSFQVVQDRVEGVEGVLGMCPHLLRPGLLCGGDLDDAGRLTIRVDEASPIQIVGVDPVLEATVTQFLDYLRRLGPAEGGVDDPTRPFARPAGSESDLPVVVVGVGLAEDREISKGDVIALVSVPEDGPVGGAGGGEPRVLADRFLVGGILLTGHYQNDKTQVFCDLGVAQAFADVKDSSTEICVRVSEDEDLAVFAATLNEHLRSQQVPVVVETWYSRHGRYMASIENQRSILGFLLFFFVAVACFNVFATLTMLVSDKTRDIGVLNAMGSSTTGIASIFVIAAVMITGVGGALGTATGIWLANHMNAVNDAIEVMFDVRLFRPDIYVFEEVPIELEPWFVITVLGATMALAIVSALVPALRAARLDPVTALRYE